MIYDYSRLLGKIREKYKNDKYFARALGISERTMSLKLNNKVGFKQAEIENICKLLEISNREIQEYFFVKKVQ